MKNKFTIDIPITMIKVVTIQTDMTEEELEALVEKDPANFFETEIYENESLELVDEYIEEDGLLYDETDVQIFQKD